MSWALTSTVSKEFRLEVLLVFLVKIFKIVVVFDFFKDSFDDIVRNGCFLKGLAMPQKNIQSYPLLLTELFSKLVVFESLIC